MRVYNTSKQAICCCEFCSKGQTNLIPTGSTKAAIVEEKSLKEKKTT
jgi:hypothetical protein